MSWIERVPWCQIWKTNDSSSVHICFDILLCSELLLSLVKCRSTLHFSLNVFCSILQHWDMAGAKFGEKA